MQFNVIFNELEIRKRKLENVKNFRMFRKRKRNFDIARPYGTRGIVEI